jgi:hypothetical protein
MDMLLPLWNNTSVCPNHDFSLIFNIESSVYFCAVHNVSLGELVYLGFIYFYSENGNSSSCRSRSVGELSIDSIYWYCTSLHFTSYFYNNYIIW